jgi:serine/threonine protein kinase
MHTLITGGFSYVYLVKEISDASAGQSLNNTVHGGEGSTAQRSGSITGGTPTKRAGSIGRGSESEGERKDMVLKVTSIVSRTQRDIAEKEAKLLSRLSHPSIIKMYDTCYRTVPQSTTKRGKKSTTDDDAGGGSKKDRPQHLILMEHCEGGGALQVCTNMLANSTRFDLSTLIIAFGQICNAVSYLHAQRPPIVHRDLKPDNFLVKHGAYKLCDFGSAVFGHVDLKTPQARNEAEEVIEKTTTQMFRAPEMVDLYSAKKLTQATDVWALGCCLFSMAFLQNCFEEGSNLAILSRNFKIPEDNPYGEGLVELIDRMLTVDVKARSDMTEVILCLSAVYSGRPLPPRKEPKAKKESKRGDKATDDSKTSPKTQRVGTFRTDGQGLVADDLLLDAADKTKPKEGKTLNPNSVAARRKKTASSNMHFSTFHSKFEEVAADANKEQVNQDMAFSTEGIEHFAAFGEASATGGGEGDIFGAFGDAADGDVNGDAMTAFGSSQDPFATFSADELDNEDVGNSPPRRQRAKSMSRRPRRKADGAKSDDASAIEAAAQAFSGDSDDGNEENGNSATATAQNRKPRGRGVRRQTSIGTPARRTKSKGRVKSRRTIRTSSGQDDNSDSDSSDDGDSDDE